jgi:hypothetical protein
MTTVKKVIDQPSLKACARVFSRNFPEVLCLRQGEASGRGIG